MNNVQNVSVKIDTSLKSAEIISKDLTSNINPTVLMASIIPVVFVALLFASILAVVLYKFLVGYFRMKHVFMLTSHLSINLHLILGK